MRFWTAEMIVSEDVSRNWRLLFKTKEIILTKRYRIGSVEEFLHTTDRVSYAGGSQVAVRTRF
jgi:hypothetical protein